MATDETVAQRNVSRATSPSRRLLMGDLDVVVLHYCRDGSPVLVRTWVSVSAVAWLLAGCQDAGAQPHRISDDFHGPDGLIAAEHHPATDDSHWEVTSGSLFRLDDTGWSGQPDAGGPPPATGSAVFRMVSVDRGLSDVDVSVRLRVDALSETERTPARDYDGLHVWLRYESDKMLYAVSVDRRDGQMIIKKKCEGGDDNGGTYYDLAPWVRDMPIPFGTWQQVFVSVRDQPDGSVKINASRDGAQMEAIDDGVGCAPLRGNGGVGIRGDNAEFRLADITVDDVAQ